MRWWLLLAIGCADLPELEAGKCGNGVLDVGEDCDTIDEFDRSCTECKLTCAAGSECPEAWSCGPDLICRRASGTFEILDRIAFAPELGRTRVADVDGDGFEDLVAETQDALTWWRGGPRGLEETEPLAIELRSFATGDLDADGTAEIVAAVEMGQSSGLSIVTGSSGRLRISPREGRPTNRPRYQPAAIADQIALAALDSVAFALQNDGGLIHLLRLEDEVDCSPEFIEIVQAALLPPRRIEVARTQTDGGRGIMALSGAGADGVALVSIDLNSDDCGLVVSPVATPPATAVARSSVELADIDGDGATDVLFLVRTPTTSDELAVALGTGDGSFGPASVVTSPRVPEPASELIPNCARWMPAVVDLPPILAAGDLNGDRRADLVGPRVAVPGVRNSLWWAAEIADFNADGNADIVAVGLSLACEFVPGIDFLLGDGRGNFVVHELLGPAQGHTLAVGDFDGDRIDDLAVADGDPFLSERSSVWIFYGDPGRGLVDFRRIELDERVESIASSRRIDGFSDLLVLTAGGPRWLTVLRGNAARVPDAPIDLGKFSGGPVALAVGPIDLGRGDDIFVSTNFEERYRTAFFFSGLPAQRPLPAFKFEGPDQPTGDAFAIASSTVSGRRGTIFAADAVELSHFELDAFGDVVRPVYRDFPLFGRPASVEIARLDAGGDGDVIIEFAPGPTDCRQALVLPNALDGAIPDAISIEDEPGRCSVRAKPIQADADPEHELIVDLDRAVVLVEWTGDGVEIRKSLASLVDGFDVGDFDGDGIDDVLIAGDGLTLLRGCPHDAPCE